MARRGIFGCKVTGTCHYEKKIGAIIPCHHLKNETHNSVSLIMSNINQILSLTLAAFLLFSNNIKIKHCLKERVQVLCTIFFCILIVHLSNNSVNTFGNVDKIMWHHNHFQIFLDFDAAWEHQMCCCSSNHIFCLFPSWISNNLSDWLTTQVSFKL